MNNDCQRIRYLKDVKGLSFHQIEMETGVPRKKASKIYLGISSEAKPRDFLLDPYHQLIASWFAEIPSLKVIQVWKRLKERGVAVSYRSTAEYTEEWRKEKKEKIYWPLDFLPGEEGQVDWFFVAHPILGKLSGFVLILNYSRYAYARLFSRSSFEFFIEGHILAFEDFGGSPRTLRYDNLKSVVLKREPLTYNPGFLDFAMHYGFEIRLCNPASGNEKGRVERLIRSIRETFLNVAGHHQSLGAINCALKDWIREKNSVIHRATDAIPAEKKKKEKLKPLPCNRWRNALIHPKLPTKTGLVIFDTNFYSVPEYLGCKPLSLHAFTDRIEIYDRRGNRIAAHPRSFERKKEILNPIHRSGRRLSETAKKERIHNVIKNMDPAVESFLEQNRLQGECPHQTAYALFKLLREHSRGLLLSLIRNAIQNKNCKMKFLLSRLTAPEIISETVYPQNPSLLTLDYQRRPLEDYDE